MKISRDGTFLFLRTVGVYLIAVMIWIIWRVPPLLSGDHVGFQSAGTIIICWGILFIGKRRIAYEKLIDISNRNTMMIAINRLEAHREVNEKRLEFTFRIHALELSKICRRLGYQSIAGPTTDTDISKEELKIAEFIQNTPDAYVIDEDKLLFEEIKRNTEFRKDYGWWHNVEFNTELTFLIIGTLQTGYGANLSLFLWDSGVVAIIHPFLSFL